MTLELLPAVVYISNIHSSHNTYRFSFGSLSPWSSFGANFTLFKDALRVIPLSVPLYFCGYYRYLWSYPRTISPFGPLNPCGPFSPTSPWRHQMKHTQLFIDGTSSLLAAVRHQVVFFLCFTNKKRLTVLPMMPAMPGLPLKPGKPWGQRETDAR